MNPNKSYKFFAINTQIYCKVHCISLHERLNYLLTFKAILKLFFHATSSREDTFRKLGKKLLKEKREKEKMVLKDTNRRCLSLWPLGECRYNDFLFKGFNFKGTFLNLFSSQNEKNCVLSMKNKSSKEIYK